MTRTPALTELLASNAYPGRGIVLGMDETRSFAVAMYFIMGRSENSRNRVFVLESDRLKTRAFDESRVKDPSLIIYDPVRMLPDGRMIITNGDQTDTIAQALKNNRAFEDALRTRTFEPDAPNWTPRISGLLSTSRNSAEYRLCLIRGDSVHDPLPQRFFYEYTGRPGVGHFLHTYAHDGDPLPPFRGEPEEVFIPGSQDALTESVWDSLDAQNRIALYTCFTDLATGARTACVINKHVQSAQVLR